ncbi:MAG TPA: undecaprenyl-phosphate glucose phosphotransferase, partial [Burkholderiales bacterium]|nr:undecaprenyl-phosphate glucose phosphotransferase [Burkholderiales bacterium]
MFASANPSLLKSQVSFLSVLRATLDPLLIIACLIAIVALRDDGFYNRYVVLSLIVFSLTFPGNISLATGTRALLKEIVLGWMVIVLILLFLGYATQYLAVFPPDVLVTWAVSVPIVLFVAHRAIPLLLPKIMAMEGVRTAVIASTNDLGLRLAGQFQDNSYLGVTFVGFFDDRAPTRIGQNSTGQLLGRIADLPRFVNQHRIDAIFITLPMASQPRILKLLDELSDTTASIYFVPDIFVFDLIQARMDHIGGIPVVAVCESPFYGVNGMVKRLSDVLLATFILLLISPLMLAIAAAVKLTSPGPVLFKQRRYGADGREIIVYKFRSMTVCEDGEQIQQATKNDQRTTPLGAFLRRTSLDELPQFINVLQGRMSVVGPRPHAIAHNELYRRLIKGYMVRHKVKPGITGWAQVNGY